LPACRGTWHVSQGGIAEREWAKSHQALIRRITITARHVAAKECQKRSFDLGSGR